MVRKEKEAEREKEAETKPKSGLDFKIILVGLVIFLVAMGASYFLMRSLMSPLLPKEDKKAETIETGDLVSAGEFTTNINDIAGTRYLKVEVYVEVSDKKVKDSIDQYMPVIKDSILSILASQTVADLDVRNRDNLKTEIKKDLNNKIGSNVISNVYFTNFIMQ